jgi:hypothetical protein
MPVAACPVDCPSCGAAGPQVGAENDPAGGGLLAGISILVFVVPLATTLVGALLAGVGPVEQLAGGFIGLGTGMITARWLVTAGAERRRRSG